MDELFIIGLVLAAIALYVWLAILFFSYVALPVGLALGGLFAAVFLSTYGKSVWGVMVASPGSQVIVHHPAHDPHADGEPAFQQYFYGQAVGDLRTSLTEAFAGCRSIATALIERIREWAFGGLWLVTWPLGVAALGALGASIAVAAAVVLALAVIHIAVVLVLQAIMRFVALLLRFADRTMRTVRRARITCPGCHEHVAFPAYECPGDSCIQLHRDVRPGRYGLRSRICQCGQRMPTLFMFGSYRLDAYCPFDGCLERLADQVGTAREFVLPVLGATGAGKTRLMASAVLELESDCDLAVEFADGESSKNFDLLRNQLATGGNTQKTNAALPRAYSLYIERGSGKRLLHIFDAAGEWYHSTDRMQDLRYLAVAETFVLVINPLSIPAMWRSLDGASKRRFQAHRSPDEPSRVYFTSVDNIRLQRVDPSECRLAVVVSKADLLGDLDGYPTAGSASHVVEAWLSDSVGLGNMIRSINANFDSVRFFSTAALAPSGKVDTGITDLLSWTLADSLARPAMSA